MGLNEAGLKSRIRWTLLPLEVLGDHVAQIDADAEDNSPLWRDLRLPYGGFLLDGPLTDDGVADRTELDEGAIALQLDDSAMMLAEERIDHLATQSLDGG